MIGLYKPNDDDAVRKILSRYDRSLQSCATFHWNNVRLLTRRPTQMQMYLHGRTMITLISPIQSHYVNALDGQSINEY